MNEKDIKSSERTDNEVLEDSNKVDDLDNSVSSSELSLSSDSIEALGDYYYDTYYADVIKSLNNIQSSISNNHNEIKTINNQIYTSLSCFTFVFVIFFIYYLMRNMIILKK